MHSLLLTFPVLAILAWSVAGQGIGVILSAQGAPDSPISVAYQVNLTNPEDANIINKTEIMDNITNECGRTLLNGNIDAGAVTEDDLAAKQITTVTKGSRVVATINQGGPLGAGPYTCDVDLTSNSATSIGQKPLDVMEVAGAQPGLITLSIGMPANLTCIGGSVGNCCTVRCYNAQNYGGCFAVQQTDIEPAKLYPDTIPTKMSLKAMFDQIFVNRKDFPIALQANQVKGEGPMAVAAANMLVEAHTGNKSDTVSMPMKKTNQRRMVQPTEEK